MEHSSLHSFLKSEASQKEFTHCNVCETSLENNSYIVEKAFQQNPETGKHFVIFEYAMCFHCKTNMMKELSKESFQNIKRLAEEFQEKGQIQDLLNADYFNPNKCSVTGKKVDEMESYHTVCVVQSNGAENHITPLLYGIEIIEAYADVLSNETQDFFDDFYDQFIDIPPALAKILNSDIKTVIL